MGYCYDVIDSPDGNDPALRPNQIFAVSLPARLSQISGSPLLLPREQKGIVDAVAQSLLTSHGLRSLFPRRSQLCRSLRRRSLSTRRSLSSRDGMGLAHRSFCPSPLTGVQKSCFSTGISRPDGTPSQNCLRRESQRDFRWRCPHDSERGVCSSVDGRRGVARMAVINEQ
jgi:hypothetical protein